MLESRWMHAASRVAILIAVGSVLIIPNPRVCAGTLREEAVAYRAQGYEAQQRGDLGTALTWYQKAAELDPAYPAPLNDIGVIAEEQGRFDEAEQWYQRALAINPKYLGAHANLAMLYERRGDQAKAIEHWLQRARAGDARDPWTSRAKERLVALGVLHDPLTKQTLDTRRLVVEQELNGYDQSIEEFHAVTESHGDWP